MNGIDRRGFLGFMVAGACAPLLFPMPTRAGTDAHVVVVGGGFGGATCANYLRLYDAGVRITLIDRNAKYMTCPFSNLLLSGEGTPATITHDYARLAGRDIDFVHAPVVDIDPGKKSLSLESGDILPYDRLVVSPGVSFRHAGIDGYDSVTGERMPHAWQSGEQTLMLRKRLQAMDDGGVVVIALPTGPYRAPPAPYERASLIAHYLSASKPRSKILVIDPSQGSDELAIFRHLWQGLYPGMIEWVNDQVEGADPQSMTLAARSGQKYSGDIINLIPPQQAGELALRAGLADASGWCPVNQKTFESVVSEDVHVIGDACIAGAMPKTGHAASSQAKICAAAIVAGLRAEALPDAPCSTSIYSFINPEYAISTAAVYRLTDGVFREVSGGISPKDAPSRVRAKEASYARGWYRAITSEMFAMQA